MKTVLQYWKAEFWKKISSTWDVKKSRRQFFIAEDVTEETIELSAKQQMQQQRYTFAEYQTNPLLKPLIDEFMKTCEDTVIKAATEKHNQRIVKLKGSSKSSNNHVSLDDKPGRSVARKVSVSTIYFSFLIVYALSFSNFFTERCIRKVMEQ